MGHLFAPNLFKWNIFFNTNLYFSNLLSALFFQIGSDIETGYFNDGFGKTISLSNDGKCFAIGGDFISQSNNLSGFGEVRVFEKIKYKLK